MAKLPWHNDYPLDPARVRDILGVDLGAELTLEHVVALGEGWDFTTYLIDGEWVFRFPKRRQSARQLARERRLLDAIGDALADQPVAIPRYRYVVERSKRFALGYVGYPLLRGDALVDCHDELDPAVIGRELGRFLKQLQTAPAPLRPPRVYRDSFPSDLIEFRREFADARASLPESIAAACERLLARTPPRDPGPPVFQHGDLGAEHILIDRARGSIVAVIDWGDAGWGNGVADVVGLWGWGGDPAVAAAVSEWGRVMSTDDWIRLRTWGVAYAIGTAYYGYKDGRQGLHAAALRWLDRMNRAGQLDDPAARDG